MSDNIHVAVRMRPLISREIESKAAIHWNAQKTSTICQSNSPAVAFHFDRVFRGRENNEVVYSEFCSPIVKSVIDGFNGTIFAYGQTSSGKTFTMMGDDDGKTLGVIHYTVSDIFTFIQDMPEREFLLRVSYMEIYNEMVRDLLSDKNEENLRLQEDQYGVIKVSGLSEHIVQEADQVLSLMRQAERKRRTGETLMNEKSSRSHSIFRMIIESGLKGESEAAVNVSQFNLVDLAGSERARQTGAKGARFRESVNINKSLLELSRVISQLSEKVVNDQFINYRDSKLTRILQNSLGGNARTAIICTVTPACLEETLSTLKFAERAKRIRNKPEVNEVLTEQALLKQYANKIKKLTKELEATKEEKAQQNKSLQEQIHNLKKSYVFQIAPEVKSRSNRRETWGGCLDAARLRMDILVPRKPLTSADMSVEDDFLKPRCLTPQRKYMPPLEERSSMPCPPRNRFLSSDLPTLEEEIDGDMDTFVDNSFFQSSKLVVRQSYDAPRQSDAIFQTDARLEPSILSTLQLELIQKQKERILFLEKELAELIDVTTLERQLLRSKNRHSLDSKNSLSLDLEVVSEVSKTEHLNVTHEIPLDTDKTTYSQLEDMNVDAKQEGVNECVIRSDTTILTEDPVCASDCVLETEIVNNADVLDSKSILPDVEMQSTLPEFNNDEFYDYLGNTIKMLGMRKSIDLVPVKDNLNSHYNVMLDMFNLVMQYQCLTFKGSFKTDLAEKIEEISLDLTRIFQSFSADSVFGDAIEHLVENFMHKTDGVLKEIEMFSLDADDGKHGILNQSVYNESFLQRHSFEDSVINVSNVMSPRFLPLRTIVEDSINNANELLSTSANADANSDLQFTNEKDLREHISTLEKDIEVYRKSVLDLQYESELKDKQVLILKDKLEIQETVIDGLKGELAFKSDEANNLNTAQSQVEANLQVTFNDLLELRIFALEFMKREMNKFLGDVEFLENNANSPIWDQIKIEVTALKELLVRLEFYIKNQNESKEYFQEVLEKNMLENGTLNEQLKQVELSLKKHLKEKDAEQLNLNKVLLDMDISISELMQNVKASDSVGKTSSYVDGEETKYPMFGKNKPVKYIELIQKKVLSIGSFINENTSLVADLSVKLQETEDKLNNFKEKDQQSLQLTKSVQTVEDSRLLDMSIKLEEAEVCLEDLKKDISSLTLKLEIMNNEKETLEDKLRESNRTIENMQEDFEIKNINWSVSTMECVKKVEEKCDQMMIEQENKFFDDIDKLKQEHKTQILKRADNYKVEKEQWQFKVEELTKQHQTNMAEVYNERFKLDEEISALKEKIHNITQLNTCMKDKYRRYASQMKEKLKEKGNRSVQEKESQTELLQSETLKENAPTKTTKDNPIYVSVGMNAKSEHCSHCKVLMQKISDLQISKQQANPDIVQEVETNKRLKRELFDLRSDIVSAKSNNTNLIKENVSLKQELSSKLVLLRSCRCRLNPKPFDEVTDEDNRLGKFEASAQKVLVGTTNIYQTRDFLYKNGCHNQKYFSVSGSQKRKLICEGTQEEVKSSDSRKEILTIDSADILKNEIVQRAIQEEAKSLQMAALSNGSGPDGIMKCAYLNLKLKKKDKELEKKNKELEMLKKEQANHVYSSKRHAVEALENQPLNAVEEKKISRPFHPFPQGVVPKVQPKKILKEVNRNDPTSNYDYAVNNPIPKKSNMGDLAENRALVTDPSNDFLKINKNNENKALDPEYEKRRQIEKLTGEAPECKQQ